MVRPLTTTGSVRPNRSGFRSTTTETSVVPAPEVGVTCNHVGAFSTTHRQPFWRVTVNRNEPPIAGIDTDSRLSCAMHVVGSGGSILGGSCVTAITNPPILTEPDRTVEPSFALTPNRLEPDPVTEPVGMPIHVTSVPVTDHLQSALAETEKATSCAAAVSLTARGSTAEGQGGEGGASCVTAIASPPILTEPDREEPSLALTANVLLPDPAKEPVGTPIHAASVPTDQLQSADAEIEMATSCAAAVSLTLRGSTVVGQGGGGGGGGASCVTEIIRPLTLTSAARAGPSFALTTNVPIADPAPERVVSAIHDVPVETDHLQSAGAETRKLTVSPLAFTRTLPGSTDAGHGPGSGV